MTVVSRAFVLLLGLAGCKGKPAPQVSTEDATPATRVPDLCETYLDRQWQAVQPALKRLGVADPVPLEADYKQMFSTTVRRCRELTQEQRTCLGEHDPPFGRGIDACQINEDRNPNDVLFVPTLYRYATVLEPGPMAASEAEALREALRGRWTNGSGPGGSVITWDVKKGGEVTERVKSSRGETSSEFVLNFPAAGRVRVVWNPTSMQDRAFLLSGDAFYMDRNLAYGPYRVENPDRFELRDNDAYIFYDGGTCQVVSATGLMVSGKCAATKEGFEASYTLPDGERTSRFVRVGDHLIAEALARTGKFIRQR